MLIFEKDTLSTEIESLVNIYGNNRAALLPILQAVEKKFNYVPDFAQQEISKLLDIHPVEVYSVISFYHFLHSKPQAKNIVRLCKTISCSLAGKEKVEEAVQRELGICFGETSPDNKIKLEYTNCIGMCDQGPAMIINDRVFTKLNPEKACEILNELI